MTLSVGICRTHGEWVAQNATKVLAVAIVITIVLCLGLIRLNVETRPEKVFDEFNYVCVHFGREFHLIVIS